jgi:RNA polymerase sigma factor (sigma-70 family)
MLETTGQISQYNGQSVNKTPEELVQEAMPHIRRSAFVLRHKYYYFGGMVPLDDLIQEGALAALRQTRTYVPGERPFVSYARKGIEGAMAEFFRRRNLRYLFICQYPDPTQVPEKAIVSLDCARIENHDLLSKAIDRLSPQKAYVLRGVYFENKTQTAIGREMQLQHSRVSELHTTALEEIRTYFRRKGITASVLETRAKTVYQY